MVDAHLVLHLHGFQNHQQVTGVDTVAGLDLPLDNEGLQRGTNLRHSLNYHSGRPSRVAEVAAETPSAGAAYACQTPKPCSRKAMPSSTSMSRAPS